MRFITRMLPWALAAGLCSITGAARATLTLYTSQSAFMGAVSGVGVDSFDDLLTTGTANPMTRSAGTHAYTASTGTQGFLEIDSGDAVDFWLSTDTSTDVITFDSFGTGVDAIGGLFFGTETFGAEVPGQSILLEATDSSGALSYQLVNADRNSFIGFVSDGTLLSLRVSAVQPDAFNLWPTVNDLVLAAANDGGGGNPVPEPTSLALAMLGVFGSWQVSRRRRCS